MNANDARFNDTIRHATHLEGRRRRRGRRSPAAAAPKGRPAPVHTASSHRGRRRRRRRGAADPHAGNHHAPCSLKLEHGSGCCLHARSLDSRECHDNGHAPLAARTLLLARWLSHVCHSRARTHTTLPTRYRLPALLASRRADRCDTSEVGRPFPHTPRDATPKVPERARTRDSNAPAKLKSFNSRKIDVSFAI